MVANTKRSSRAVNKSPVFYGWVVWFVSMLGIFATSPGQSFSVSLFFDFFIQDFGIDRTTASGLYGLGTFCAGLTLTWVGRKVDQYGNRRMGMVVGLLFALVLILFSLVSGPIALLFGFFGIRALGQGALSLVSSTAVAQWFRLRRGRMMALTVLGFALFQSVYVNGLRVLLETMDWRQVWIILGVAVALSVMPLMFLLMRDKPEDYDLLPDGEIKVKRDSGFEAEDEEDNWTLREAMGTSIMWIFLLARLIPPAWGTGLILHQVSIFGELGHSAQTTTEIYALMSLFSAGFSLLVGYLVDKFRPSHIVTVQMFAMGLACILGIYMSESWMLIVYAITFGFVMGCGGVFDGAVWANLFGRKHHGSIRGFVITAGVIGSGIGPTLFGISYDHAGGYGAVLWIGAFLSLTALIMSLFAQMPERKQNIVPSPV